MISSAHTSKTRPSGSARLTFVIVLLAAGLRFYQLGAQSLWYDEGNSAAMVGRGIAQIVAAASGDIHPPFYYLLLAGWGALASKSELSLRLLSALFGVIAVAMMFALGKKLFDRRVAVIAAALVALNPFQVYYGQEARMYMLVTLLSAASALLVAHVLTIPGEMASGRFRPRRAGAIIAAYVLVNAAGLYTHYIFPGCPARRIADFYRLAAAPPKEIPRPGHLGHPPGWRADPVSALAAHCDPPARRMAAPDSGRYRLHGRA